MNRPLVWIFFTYLLGILGGWYLHSTILFLGFAVLTMYYLYKKSRWNGVFIFPLILLMGYINIGESTKPTDAILDLLINNNVINHRVEIIGVVDNIDYFKNKELRCTIESQKIIHKNNTFTKPIKIKVYLKSDIPIQYGDVLCIKGELESFSFPRNPGGFNEYLYMKTKGVEYKIFAELVNKKSGSKSINSVMYELRLKFEQVYDKLLPTKQSALLKAIILGEKSELDEEQKIMYQQAGISHILAISGLHISILALFLWGIFRIIKVSDILSTVFILTFLWIYCIFTGLSVSTLRAVLMISVVLVGKLLRRDYDIYTSIALAAFLILINQPLYLWDAGFQLSFAAVLGLVFLSPFFSRIFYIPKKLREFLIPTMGAGLATLPIVAYHFYYISIIGFIINLIIVPLASLIVGFGFVGGIIGLFWVQGARFIVGIVYYIFCFYEFISKSFIKFPYSNIITGAPSILGIMTYYITLLGIIFYIYYRKRFDLDKRVLYFFLFLCTLLWSVVLFNPNSFEVVFLDVGQGDAEVIHTKNNKTLLIDGGDKDPKRVLLPYFKYKGISHLEGVFLTHPDKDHLLGLLGLLEYIDIKKIFVSVVDNGEDKIYHQFIRRTRELGIPCYLLKQGDQISFDEAKVYCLYPKSNNIRPKQEGWNESSMVLRVTYGDNSFLLTGDIEKEGESSIVNTYRSIECDFLKVPHHGSNTSSTEKFLDWCSPTNAVISCGENNRYGHPHKEILRRYNNRYIRTITTANNGAVIVNLDEKSYKINTMIEGNKDNGYERTKRANKEKYIFTSLLIIWGGAVLKKVLFRRDTKETNVF